MVIDTNKVSSERGTSRRVAGEVARQCSWFERECRRRRLRVTVQRLAVYRALAEEVAHPAAEHLYAKLKGQLTGLSLATVYRILESLAAEGLVHRISGMDGVGRFDANLTRHQHLVCRNCGRIADLDEESLAGIRLPQVGRAQFTPEALDIRVIGICAPCRKRAPLGLGATGKAITARERKTPRANRHSPRAQ